MALLQGLVRGVPMREGWGRAPLAAKKKQRMGHALLGRSESDQAWGLVAGYAA